MSGAVETGDSAPIAAVDSDLAPVGLAEPVVDEGDETSEDEGEETADAQEPGEGEPATEDDLNFELPDDFDADWTDEMKLAFKSKMKATENQWKGKYGQKRMAETAEMRKVREDLESLQAFKEEVEEAYNNRSAQSSQAAGQEAGGLAELLSQIEDHDNSEFTGRLLEAKGTEILQQVEEMLESAFDSRLGPYKQVLQEQMFDRNISAVEADESIGDGFIDEHRAAIIEVIEGYGKDPDYADLGESAILRLAAKEVSWKLGQTESTEQKPKPIARHPAAGSPRGGSPRPTGSTEVVADDDFEKVYNSAIKKVKVRQARRGG